MNFNKAKFNKPLAIGCGVLALAGFCGWVFQQMNGLGVTGMSNLTSWGTYICLFMLFVGLSAGGLIVASSASVFNIKSFKPVALPAIITSLVCICAAGVFVLVDVGGIQRIWRLITGMNFTSPLAWDVIVITTYIILNIIYLRLYTRPVPDHDKIKVVSCIALPVAILVHSVTAWIFGLQIGREWYSAIMAPLFVASACDSGLALLLIVLAILKKRGIFDTGHSLFVDLAGLLAVFVIVDGYMIGCECLTMAYPGGTSGAYLAMLATGPTAPFFWFDIICGVIIPFVLLCPRKRRENDNIVIGAAALVVLGVLCKRIWLLFTAFIEANIAYAPGITLGNGNLVGGTAYQIVGTYAPTAVEIVIALGVIAATILAFQIIAGFVFKGDGADGAAADSHDAVGETAAAVA